MQIYLGRGRERSISLHVPRGFVRFRGLEVIRAFSGHSSASKQIRSTFLGDDVIDP